MPKPTPYAAPALDKGLDILEHLSAVGIPQSQTEIADAIGRSQTELFRMLARLEARGYILRDEHSTKYELSLKLYQLSHTHSPVDSLRRAALQPMRDLSASLGHPSHLCVLDRDALMVVTQVRGPNPVSISIEEGSRFPLVSTTSGKLLLACVSDDERSSLLSRSPVFTSWSKSRQRDYLASLDGIREKRHLAANSEITQGVSDIAVLIGEPGGPVIGTLAISYVISSLGSASDPAQLTKALLTAVDETNRLSGLKP